jgi:hypothetical protein
MIKRVFTWILKLVWNLVWFVVQVVWDYTKWLAREAWHLERPSRSYRPWWMDKKWPQ